MSGIDFFFSDPLFLLYTLLAQVVFLQSPCPEYGELPVCGIGVKGGCRVAGCTGQCVPVTRAELVASFTAITHFLLLYRNKFDTVSSLRFSPFTL